MTTPRKIGVLTFHRCINYGSYWQARALVEGLRGRGFDAVLLDHRSDRVNRAEWRCALTPHRPAPTSRADRAAYARKTRRFFAAFERLPLSPSFSLERVDPIEAYDLVLVGSDEVWNRRHPWYGRQGLFYGAGLKARMVAYAASFGNDPADERLDASLARMLGRFDAISVRDENSLRMIRDSLGQDAALVLDPCLQFPQITRRPPSRPGGEAGDYVLVYGHGFPDWFQSGVRDAARARGLRLRSIGYRNDWADEHWLDAGPEDFADAVANASAVATTFFHGCVFALLHGRPFVCAASDYRAFKVRSLVSLVGAAERLAERETEAAGYAAAIEVPLAPEVGRRLAALRARSDAYLADVLA